MTRPKYISIRLALISSLLVTIALTSLSAAQQQPNTSSTSSVTTTTTPTEEPEVITSIATDNIGPGDVTTISNTDDHEGEDSTEISASGGLIEAKSISHAGAEAENSVIASDTNARLSIDPDEPSGESNTTTTTSESNTADNGHATGGHSHHKKQSMPRHLNLTQIDEIYLEGRKDEQETVENWNRISRKVKNGISGIIGAAVPLALNMSQEALISSNCSGAMLKWVLSMNQLKAWALKMLDASGKPIAGLLEGSMTMFGNYRQCLKIRAPDDDEIEFTGGFKEYFRGKYCIIQAKPWLPKKERFYNLNAKLKLLVSEEENAWYDRTIFEELNEWLLAFNFVNIRFDLCVPSMCSREDIQKAVNYLLKGVDLKARVARCEMDLPDGKLGVAAQVETGSHEVAEALAAMAAASISADAPTSKLNHFRIFSQLGWVLLPLIVFGLVMLATLLSLTIGDDSNSKRNKLKYTIKSISLKRSMGSHLNVDYDQLADDKPLALYGLRFILVLWVIMVESAVNLKFEYLRELLMLKDLIFWWPMQFIINSTLQYDSLILLTAFTMAYKNCLNDSVNTAKSLTRFVIDKYVRLMPSIMVMVAMVILLPLVYRGPVWNDYVAKQSAVCQSTGWVNSMFLQNYLPYEDICLPQTWLLCVELQLVLIMAPLVYYLNKGYTSNFGCIREKGMMTMKGNGVGVGGYDKQLGKSNQKPKTSSRHDSSKLCHWFWTTPGFILIACIVLGMGTSFYNVYYNDLPPSWFYTMADPDSKALYFGGHMTRILTHLAVFAMGILAGVECRRATKNVHRGYRCSNINYLAYTNSLSSSHQKSHSSSVSSLPITLAQTGAASDITTMSRLSASDHWNTKKGIGAAGSNSSVSINISANHHDNNSTSGSDIGCINSSSGGGCEYGTDGDAVNGRGVCLILLDILGFIIAITIMSAVIFSTHDWSLNELPKPLVAGAFDAGSRFLWSLCLIWILFKISIPYKDRSFPLLARALGHPAMVCLGKLSFLIYIIHPFVHTTVLAIQEQPIYSSWLMLFHILIGNITITVILASIISLFVEMPCRNLFRRCGTSLLLTQSNIHHRNDSNNDNNHNNNTNNNNNNQDNNNHRGNHGGGSNGSTTVG